MTSMREDIGDAVEKAAVKAERDSAGRRWQDTVREKSAWLLVIGVLMQSGFLLVCWKLISLGESQLDRERAMLATQHSEVVQSIRDLALVCRTPQVVPIAVVPAPQPTKKE